MLCLAMLGCGASFRQPTSATLGWAYGAAASVPEATASAGSYVLAPTTDGGVYIMRRAGLGRAAPDSVSDSAITTRVRTKIAGDPVLKGSPIGVDTDLGIVTLHGVVASRARAARAAGLALNTKGVTAVDSELRYPRLPD
jgi:osmotically-inducible protein OsmY